MSIKPVIVRTWFIPFCLLSFCFLLPLQCFIIGDDFGLGVQGALFRYQMTEQGTSLIPVTYEIDYIISGIYQGKTADSLILWAFGTFVLACTTIVSLISWNTISHRTLGFITVGIAGSCIFYLASSITRYGLFLSGPTGTTLPCGVVIMAIFAGFLHFYQDFFGGHSTAPAGKL